MTNVELTALSLPELKQLQNDIAKAIANFDGHRKLGAIAALEEKAREFGFKLADLMSLSAPKSRKPAKPKYCHPENAAVTWSGRGRRPLWFVAGMAAGKSPKDMEI